MTIRETVEVIVADVEVSDEYTVDLITPESRRHRTRLSTEQAYRLADAIYAAASRAETLAARDGQVHP